MPDHVTKTSEESICRCCGATTNVSDVRWFLRTLTPSSFRWWEDVAWLICHQRWTSCHWWVLSWNLFVSGSCWTRRNERSTAWCSATWTSPRWTCARRTPSAWSSVLGLNTRGLKTQHPALLQWIHAQRRSPLSHLWTTYHRLCCQLGASVLEPVTDKVLLSYHFCTQCLSTW